MNSDRLTVKLETKNLHLFYGNFMALKDVSIKIYTNKVTAVIGPSGCGKSTLLRVFNRMNETIPKVKITGETNFNGQPMNNLRVTELRKQIGMVFQRPNPFPISIFANIAYGPKIHGMVKSKDELYNRVSESLKATGLWYELKNFLDRLATSLSLEQQQRLCISRLLAVRPQVLLFDEPCSALDPQAMLNIEELIVRLKEHYTVVIVTHNMQQAARVSDYTAFMLLGELIEYQDTKTIFTRPINKKTEDYLTGRFG